MDHGAFVARLNTTLLLVLRTAAPVLVVAAVIGLLVGLFQAVTQIQDQSLGQTVKLITVLVVVAVLGPLLVGPLVKQSRELFDAFPAMARSR